MSILLNNFYRIKNRKYNVLSSLVMTLIAISLAVYFTSNHTAQSSIAVVISSDVPTFQSNYFQFTVLEKQPPMYQLVLGKYDGVLLDQGHGNFKVETIKNADFRQMLEELAKNPTEFVPPVNDVRGVGTTIIGYLMMFILLQCVMFMFTLSEDLELEKFERIVTAPVSFGKYLLSHFVSTFTVIVVPAFFMLLVMKAGLGFDIGFSLWQYAVLLGILCSSGTAFALLINSLVKGADTANMMASSLVVLTTILSGSFYSIEKGNTVLEKVLWILPQKGVLSFVQGLEGGKAVSAMLPQLTYVLMIILLCLAFSILKLKKDYVLRRD